MGTQQLLLLVLVAVVVALGISVAYVYFKSNQQDVEINETVNELNHIAASAQGWYRKPKELAGGSGSFTGFTFLSIAQPDSNNIAKYSVVSANGDLLQLHADGFLNYAISVNVYPDSIGPYDIQK